MNVFLIEKKSSLNKHRVNLALSRFSTIHKTQGDSVYHFVMDSKTKLPSDIKPNKVYISIVFSWDVVYFVKLVNELKKLYNLENKDIIIDQLIKVKYKFEKLVAGFIAQQKDHFQTRTMVNLVTV